VVRLPGRLPGLYVIQTDEKGERRFSYWRANAPARDLFALPETDALCHALVRYDLIYFSGITLSLYGEHSRERLFETIERCRTSGCRIAFDTNFRSSGWPDRSAAKSAYYRAFGCADILLASQEDLELLFGNSGAAEFETCLNIQERIQELTSTQLLRPRRSRRSIRPRRATALLPHIWPLDLRVGLSKKPRVSAIGSRALSSAILGRLFRAQPCRRSYDPNCSIYLGRRVHEPWYGRFFRWRGISRP
jgi:hypothetical protein